MVFGDRMILKSAAKKDKNVPNDNWAYRDMENEVEDKLSDQMSCPLIGCQHAAPLRPNVLQTDHCLQLHPAFLIRNLLIRN